MSVFLALTKNVVMNPHDNLIKMMFFLPAYAAPFDHWARSSLFISVIAIPARTKYLESSLSLSSHLKTSKEIPPLSIGNKVGQENPLSLM